MKKLLILSIFLLIGCQVLCQNMAQKSRPFILSGQLTNFTGKNVVITHTNNTADTIPVDAEGRFYFKCDTITRPAKVLFSKRAAFFVTNLFIAPGYNLHITADCKDMQTSRLSKKITGEGATANRYIIIRDSISSSRPAIKYWDLKHDKLLIFADQDKKTSDSLFNIVFNKSRPVDRYENYFKQVIEYDNDFYRLSYLVNPAITEKDLTAQQCIAFVRNNLDPDIYKNLYKPDYLISEVYKGLMQNDYLLYLTSIDCKMDSNQCSNLVDYRIKNLEKIDVTYKGKIREMAIYSELFSAFSYARSFEELNLYGNTCPKYIAMLSDENKKKKLDKLFADRSAQVINTKVGKAAPQFVGEDSLGRSFRLSDYKGKVVLLDLWASWCEPCRQETPYFKKIVDKYKNDTEIVFISMAVQDKNKNWKAALKQDNPSWLQLFDTTAAVLKEYVANSIPKFVIIGKSGNIVSFDAPEPHTGADLTNMLDAELSK